MLGVACPKCSTLPMTNQLHSPFAKATVRSGTRPGTPGSEAGPLETSPVQGNAERSKLGETCVQPSGPKPKTIGFATMYMPGRRLSKEYQPDSVAGSMTPSPFK